MPSSGKPIRDTNGEAGVGSLQLLLPGSASGHLAAILPFTGTSQAAPGEASCKTRGEGSALPSCSGPWNDGALPSWLGVGADSRAVVQATTSRETGHRTEEGYYGSLGAWTTFSQHQRPPGGDRGDRGTPWVGHHAAAGLGLSLSQCLTSVFCPAQADHPAVPETAVIGYRTTSREKVSSTLRPGVGPQGGMDSWAGPGLSLGQAAGSPLLQAGGLGRPNSTKKKSLDSAAPLRLCHL